MGQMKRVAEDLQELEDLAESIGKQVGLFGTCEHETLMLEDSSQEKHAIIRARTMAKNGQLSVDGEDLIRAIKRLTKNTGDSCGACDRFDAS